MEEIILPKDPIADRLEAFAALVSTLDELKDEHLKAIGYEMLENAVASIRIPKPQPAAVLSVVGN